MGRAERRSQRGARGPVGSARSRKTGQRAMMRTPLRVGRRAGAPVRGERVTRHARMCPSESTQPEEHAQELRSQGGGRRDAEPPAATIALALARDQLGAQLAAADSDDVKALGYLAVDVAGSAALFATRDTLNSRWWWPTVGLAVAALRLIFALLKERYPGGPEPLEVYFAAGIGQWLAENSARWPQAAAPATAPRSWPRSR